MSQSLELNIKTKSDVPAVMGKAASAAKSFGRSVSDVKSQSDGAFGGIAAKITAMFSATVLFDRALGFVIKTFTTFGRVADQVDKSGISAEDFQRFSYAAEQAGVSVSALAKATRQLRVEMAAAANGDKTKVELFKALGISMDQIKAGDASAAFLAISAALTGSADDSERLLIATTFFGDKIGNDILPLLGNYGQLLKDISAAPVVDAKTLKTIGDATDKMQRLNNTFMVLIANIIRAYEVYSNFNQKVSEKASGIISAVEEKIGIKGFFLSAVGSVLKTNANPLMVPAAITSAILDGNNAPTPSVEDKPNQKTAAILAAIKASKQMDDKAAKVAKAEVAHSPDGNVIGVGSNPVLSAMHEQTEIAKQQLSYLRSIASSGVNNSPSPSLTDKGATPITPATRSQPQILNK